MSWIKWEGEGMADEQGWWWFKSNVGLSEEDLEHIGEAIKNGFTEGNVVKANDNEEGGQDG